MNSFKGFLDGMLGVLNITSSPMMYRYPYRSNAEALRGDMLKIGKDMETTLEKVEVREE